MAENAEISQDLKKIQIFNAARRTFSKFGFAKTTLDDIAEAVGMKKASLYYYYSCKEEIFRDVVKSETDEFILALEPKVFQVHSVKDQLKTFVKTRTEYFQKMMTLHNITVQAALEFLPLVEQIYKEFFERQFKIINTVFSQGIQNGQLRNFDSERVANVFLTAIESFGLLAIHKSKFGHEIDYQKIQDDAAYLSELIIDGLKK
ncbi:MAG: TetR/AcrR family transcriptional regulator [Bacteroidetes bacterium]|nr:TetR/AcrR family transcriptional regulator [Bacteroidota bacterium]MBU1423901.1 TetR/AcrR family transcriptional regulator [Bacteroidota bacterium]MBU2471760.1 TetR/AcrR family transcriptional regulator [Bacteroidota bacterium]MBU2636292.1 TetR/AcrR family transcriptional regulator [Bacteroidota bacterium]